MAVLKKLSPDAKKGDVVSVEILKDMTLNGTAYERGSLCLFPADALESKHSETGAYVSQAHPVRVLEEAEAVEAGLLPKPEAPKAPELPVAPVEASKELPPEPVTKP